MYGVVPTSPFTEVLGEKKTPFLIVMFPLLFIWKSEVSDSIPMLLYLRKAVIWTLFIWPQRVQFKRSALFIQGIGCHLRLFH